MKTRRAKAAPKTRDATRKKGRGTKSKRDPRGSPSMESLNNAKVEERLTALEQRLERSLSDMELKLGRGSDGRPAESDRADQSSLTSLLPGDGGAILNDLKPLIDDLAPVVLDQLEKIEFFSAVSKTFTDVVNHVSQDVDEFGYDREFEEKLGPLLEFLFYTWWRVEMNGLDNFPESGRVLLVANHSGTLPFDGAMIKFGLRELHPAHRIIRVLMHDLFNSLPVLGPILAKIGCVRACHENGEKLLQRGHATMVFPEGAKGTGKDFKQRYKLERFGRGGFVRLAARTASPIVPIAVVGAEEIYPILQNSTVVAKLLNLPYFPITPTFPWLGVLGLIPFPSKWYIDIGEPLTFDHLTCKELEDDFLMDHLGNEVRLRIQKMVDERLTQRRSVWLG